MLRVLLVDDEALELNALRDHVDWKGLGIEEVMTARNGKAAYELILEQEPDIVITDVHMPVMDGIELAGKIYELSRRIKVVFLSGYDDFSYVKSAMKMGAVDYILKPFTAKGIEEVIGRVKDALNKDRLVSYSLETLERQLLEGLCTGNEAGEEDTLYELSRVRREGSGEDKYGMLMLFHVLGKSLPDHLMKNMPGILAAWLDDGKLGVILHGYVDPGEGMRKIQGILQRLTGLTHNGVYLETHCRCAEELHDGYGILKSWENFVYYRPAGYCTGVFEGKPAENSSVLRELLPEVMQEELKRLERLFPYEDEAAAAQETEHILQLFENQQFSGKEVESNLRQLCLLLNQRMLSGSQGTQKLKLDLKKAGACRCAEELKELLTDAFGQVREASREREGGRNAYVIRKVKEYVQLHYGEPMTVEAIADELHLSVNYVRSIFREGSGQTILEYVTDYRFAKACELLKNPALRVKEVANMVGYENISYFGAVFTKRYRMTPNEYRRKFL